MKCALRWIVMAVSVGAFTLLCAGCQSIGAAAGATTAAISGVATTNPAVGIGIGIAVQAATDEVVKRTMRGLHQDQQEAIATLAGEAPVGAFSEWKVKHFLPIENGHGRVLVLRSFDTALTLCKEFAFSVMEDGDDDEALREQWFMASVCKQDQAWKWASAEPSTVRWGSLQ